MLPALRMTVLLTVLTGLVYSGLLTAICQVLFSRQANGSLIERSGKGMGSAPIGQGLSATQHFNPRSSAAGADGYHASSSGGSNVGPTSQKLIDQVKIAKANWNGPVPTDLLTASGFDPHSSPAWARLQVSRASKARALAESIGQEMIRKLTEDLDLGLLGEPRINVRLLSLALDERNR